MLIQLFINKHEFQQSYSTMFGHHGIATAACIMYSPNIAAIVLCGIHLLLVILVFFFWVCGCRIISKILWGMMLTTNAILLIMACIGVGATGYDYNLLNCYMKT